MSPPMNASSWDGELYRAVFPFPGLGQWDVDVYRALAGAVGGPILELGCGTGRILAALLGSGIDADGLELDPSMRAAAVRRLQDHGVANAAERVSLGDMRSFEARRRYRLIALPDNSVSMLEDDQDLAAALTRIRANLADGGELALDHTLLERGPQSRWPVREVEVEGVAMRVTTTGEFDEDRRIFLISIRADAEGFASRRLELRLRQRSPAELLQRLAQAGFEPVGPPLDESGRPVSDRSHVFIGRFAPTP